MKKLLLPTVLFSTLLVALPAYADCPLHTDKPQRAPAKKHVVVENPPTAPVDVPSWHDLHWFE